MGLRSGADKIMPSANQIDANSTNPSHMEIQNIDFTRDAHTRTDVLARVLRTPRAGYKGYGVQRVP